MQMYDVFLDLRVRLSSIAKKCVQTGSLAYRIMYVCVQNLDKFTFERALMHANIP